MKTLLHTPSLTARCRRQSLLAAIAMLAALVTSLALFFSLGARPAAAQDNETTNANAEEPTDANAELCFGIRDAVIERSPDTLNFGKVKRGQSKRLDVTVRGISTGCTGIFEFSGSIDTPTISGAGASSYSIANNGCNNVDLDPQKTCTLTIEFKPSGKGQQSATLNLPPKGRTSFQGGNTVSLNGIGVVKKKHH